MEFVETEAMDVDCSGGGAGGQSENEGEDVATVSDNEFIDDSEQVVDQSEYPYFTNVTRTYNDTLTDNIENLEDLDARHYFDSDDDEDDLHDFSSFPTKVKLFCNSLICPHGLENPDSFFYAILYAIRHKFTEKVDFLNDEDALKQDVGIALSHDLFEIKSLLRLDGEDKLNFENQCFKINRILSRHNMFLRVFELKNKFHYLIKQNSEQKSLLEKYLLV